MECPRSNRTTSRGDWTTSRGDGDEEEPVHGRPDHWGIEGAPGGGSRRPELCRKHGISDATFYNWRNRFGGIGAHPILPGQAA